MKTCRSNVRRSAHSMARRHRRVIDEEGQAVFRTAAEQAILDGGLPIKFDFLEEGTRFPKVKKKVGNSRIKPVPIGNCQVLVKYHRPDKGGKARPEGIRVIVKPTANPSEDAQRVAAVIKSLGHHRQNIHRQPRFAFPASGLTAASYS